MNIYTSIKGKVSFLIAVFHISTIDSFRKLCYSLFDRIKLVKLLNDASRNVYKIRIKPIGGKAVYCRSRSSDCQVLYSAFIAQYHIPPFPLNFANRAAILDLGSNAGYTMLHLKHLFPQARIIGVEMDKDNYDLCKMNVAALPDCEVIHAAIWMSNGRVTYSGKNEESYALHTGHQSEERQFDERTAQSMTIESIIENYAISTIDYLKVDIEGVEIDLLEGDLTWAKIVNQMYIEFHNTSQFRWQDYLPIALRKLNEIGFECVKSNKHGAGIFAYRVAGAPTIKNRNVPGISRG